MRTWLVNLRQREVIERHLRKVAESVQATFVRLSILVQQGKALHDFSLTEIDHEDLVGHFIRCEVDHEEVESNRTPGKMLKFVRLGDKEAADGFDEVPAAPAPAPAKKEPATKSAPAAQAGKTNGKKRFDLDSILG